MNKIASWILESNRWKHLVGGIAIGLGSDDWYCCEYAGIGVAGALEFKDWQHGCKPDWIDFGLTVVGANIGFAIKYIWK